MKKILLSLIFSILSYSVYAASISAQQYSSTIDTMLAGCPSGQFWNGTSCAVPPSGGGGGSGSAITVFNVMNYGAVGDGITDDTSAIQSAINAAEAVTVSHGAPAGEVYAPPGYAFMTTSTLTINVPIKADFRSFIVYKNTTGNALRIGTSGFQQFYDLHFAGLLPYSGYGNTSIPSSVNSSGNTGVWVTNLVFSRLEIDSVQGFTQYNVYLDGTGTTSSPQVVQHNHIELGQVINGGINLYALSSNPATSSVEANYIHIKDIYQGFFDIQFDNQGGSSATTSNYLLVDAMDNANQAAGGQGIQMNGSYNRIDLIYAGCNSWFGGTASHNTINFFNTAATGATYTAGGSNNRYNTAP